MPLRILDLGLRAPTAEAPAEYAGAAEVLELFARLPTPEEVLALRPSEGLAQRMSELVEKQRHDALSHDDEVEWQRFTDLEHLVRIAKATVAATLKDP